MVPRAMPNDPISLAKMPVSHETMAIQVDEFNRRFDRLEDRMKSLETGAGKLEEATGKILGIVESFETGIRALEFLARVIKPVSIVVASVVGAWAYMKGLKP